MKPLALPELPLPRWALVEQRLDAAPARLADVPAAIRQALCGLQAELAALRGRRVCVAVGSRGIDRLAEVVRAVVGALVDSGARPFVTPAMGSHGGATAEGQRAVLARLGIEPLTVGCPIEATMEVVRLGEVDVGGQTVPVHVDALAHAAAAVVPINRIKSHTGFVGRVESGLTKLLAIGLGNQPGASAIHACGYAAFPEVLPAVAAAKLAALRVPFAVALLENPAGAITRLEAVAGADVAAREPALLNEARQGMARLPFESLDVLVLDEIGKDISGVGLDPNVTGRDHTGRTRGRGPDIQRIVVRGLTAATAGHAAGIGTADIALARAVSAIDPAKTWINSLTARTPENARVPIAAADDRQALTMALLSCVGLRDSRRARLVRARSTKHLARLWVSEALLEDLAAVGCRALTAPAAIIFDTEGLLSETFDL